MYCICESNSVELQINSFIINIIILLVVEIVYKMEPTKHAHLALDEYRVLLEEIQINRANEPRLKRNRVLNECNVEVAPHLLDSLIYIYSENRLMMDAFPRTGSLEMWSGCI